MKSMKTWLRLMSAFVLTISTTTSIMSCGSKGPEPDIPNNDINGLLKMTNNKINSLFANLIKEKKNILMPNNFDQSDDQLLIDRLKAGEIVDTNLNQPFFNNIKNNIQDFSAKLANDSQLNILFQGFDINNILVLNTKDSKLIKNDFHEWKKDGAFGISDYTRNKYDIKSWNLLTANLKLNLQYKDNDGNNLIYEIDQNYDINFINNGAKIDQIIDLVSFEVTKQLQNYIVNLKWQKTWSLFNWSNNLKLKNDILKEINTRLSDDSVEITGSQLPQGNQNFSIAYDRKDLHVLGMGKNILLNKSQNDVKSIFINYFSNITNEMENKLNNWSYKHLIPISDLEKVLLIGEFEVNNWRYNDLILSPIKVPIILVDDKTRIERIEDTSEKVVQIMSKDSILSSRTSISGFEKDFTMTMNANDFKDYNNNGNSFGDTVTYLNDKTNSLALTSKIISSDDSLKINNFWEDTNRGQIFTNTILNSKLVDDRFLLVTTKKMSIDLWFYLNGFYFSFAYSFYSSYAVIKGDDNNVWS